jgi:hypothetical protein
MESSIRRLKAVLLHNSNQFSSIPVAHSVISRKTMRMSMNRCRKSTMNITIGMSVGTSGCWDSFQVYKVDTPSIFAFSASRTAVQLTSIMFKENGQPENNHCQAHAMLFIKP